MLINIFSLINFLLLNIDVETDRKNTNIITPRKHLMFVKMFLYISLGNKMTTLSKIRSNS
jgi:hypothetical protein